MLRRSRPDTNQQTERANADLKRVWLHCLLRNGLLDRDSKLQGTGSLEREWHKKDGQHSYGLYARVFSRRRVHGDGEEVLEDRG